MMFGPPVLIGRFVAQWVDYLLLRMFVIVNKPAGKTKSVLLKLLVNTSITLSHAR